MKRGMRIFF